MELQCVAVTGDVHQEVRAHRRGVENIIACYFGCSNGIDVHNVGAH